jgi:hypothetical protein
MPQNCYLFLERHGWDSAKNFAARKINTGASANAEGEEYIQGMSN